MSQPRVSECRELSCVLRRGHAFYQQENYAAARDVYDDLHQAGEQQGTFYLAKAEAKLDNIGRARELFEECKNFPGCSEAYYHLGELAESKGEIYFQEGMKRKDGACAYKFGVHYYHLKDVRKSLTCLRKSVAVHHSLRGEAYYALGFILWKTPKQRVAAIKYIINAGQENNEIASELLLQISCSVEVPKSQGTSDYDVALDLYHEDNVSAALAVFRKMKSAASLHIVGLIHLANENFVEGVKCLVKAASTGSGEAAEFLEMVASFME